MTTAMPGPSPAEWERLHEAQWAFVLDFYARPGVSQTCLELQDSLGVDVTVLLHAIWLHCAFGITPDLAEVAAFDSVVGPWRMQVIAPLRGACRYIKAHPSGIPAEALADLRRQIADAELKAERGAFALLAAQGWLNDRATSSMTPVEAVVRHYSGEFDSSPSRKAYEAAIALLNLNTNAYMTQRPTKVSSSPGQ